jgi:hypothetical protein
MARSLCCQARTALRRENAVVQGNARRCSSRSGGRRSVSAKNSGREYGRLFVLGHRASAALLAGDGEFLLSSRGHVVAVQGR